MHTDLSKLDAAVLVGGLGTRLRAVVSDRPKPLAEAAGRPFVAHVLEQLARAGVKHAVLCTGHMGGMFEAHIAGKISGMNVECSLETAPLGTGGAVRLAFPKLTSDPVLVLNGDSYCEADWPGFLSFYDTKKPAAALLLTQVPDVSRFGVVRTDADGNVLAFEEKGGASGPGWINAGVYIASRAFLESISVDRAVSLEKETFPAWIGRGLRAFKGGGKFIDIGTPESYAEAQKFFG